MEYRARTLNLLAAATAGAVLRGYKLQEQALVGDEWHALRVASESTVISLIGELRGGAHYSVPEAVFFRLLSQVAAVSESVIHAPYFIAGVLAIILIPLALANIVRGADTILPWLLAISPTLILFSRTARPYGMVAMFAILAVTAFARWRERQEARDLFVYCCLASIAVWLHIVAAPFVFAPLVFHLGRSLRDRTQALRAVRMALLVTAPVLLLVGVPLARHPNAVAEKVGGGHATIASTFSGLAATVGSSEIAIVVPILVLVSFGVIELFSSARSRKLLFDLAAAAGTQLAVVICAAPIAVQGPHIFARYAIPVTVCVLIVASAGLSRAVLQLPGAVVYKRATIVLLLSAFFLRTTFGIVKTGGSQMNLYYVAYFLFGPNWQEVVAREFPVAEREPYPKLASLSPRALTILEVPYKADDYFLPTRQLIHHQNVMYGVTDGFCSSVGPLDLRGALSMLRLQRTIAIGAPADIAGRSLDLVILHRDLASEVSYRPEFEPYDLEQCIDSFRRDLGAPILDEKGVVVFAVSEAGRHAILD